ncbi:MAG TPA: aspartate aminotransferase family protein [Deinococcales bacterium]|nr:aspartate aminotransferase family protein [Deinococcales bacterium]
MNYNEETFQLFARHINPAMAASLRLAGLDVVEDHAEGSFIWDADGRRYLDFLGLYGTMSVGHRHPRVVEAVKRQLDRMAMPAKIMLSRPAAELAARLSALTPGNLQYAFFGNSGAEAVEGAIKIARAATGRHKIVSAHNGFHGKTLGALSLTAKPEYQDPFRPLVPGVAHVPFGDLPALEALLDDDTAAVILEPIQGEGGVILPPPGYLKAVRDLTAARGVLLIADEVQTGLGRTGKWFAVQHEGVEPDMMTLAKALGGGIMPIGAFLARKDLWTPFEQDYKVHSTTFGGNPLACSAGLAVLDVIEEEGLVERSAELGARMLQSLKGLQEQFPYFITDVRGRGLMIGVQFVSADVGTLFISEMSKQGVLTAFGLNQPKMIRIEPPLNLSDGEAQLGLTAIEASLTAVKTELEHFGLLSEGVLALTD